MNQHALSILLTASKPFLRIDGVSPPQWRRNVQRGCRRGPWRYEAKYKVLDEACWTQPEAIVYFVADNAGSLRLVGESARRLKDRWRLSPMHDVHTNEYLGSHALFHSSAWDAIECGLDEDPPPLTASALFEPELSRILSVNRYGATTCRRSTSSTRPRFPQPGRARRGATGDFAIAAGSTASG